MERRFFDQYMKMGSVYVNSDAAQIDDGALRILRLNINSNSSFANCEMKIESS